MLFFSSFLISENVEYRKKISNISVEYVHSEFHLSLLGTVKGGLENVLYSLNQMNNKILIQFPKFYKILSFFIGIESKNSNIIKNNILINFDYLFKITNYLLIIIFQFYY